MSDIAVKITNQNDLWYDENFAVAAKNFIVQAAAVAGKSVTVTIVDGDEDAVAVDGPKGVSDMIRDAWRQGILDKMVDGDLDAESAVAKLQGAYRSKGGDAKLDNLFESKDETTKVDGEDISVADNFHVSDEFIGKSGTWRILVYKKHQSFGIWRAQRRNKANEWLDHPSSGLHDHGGVPRDVWEFAEKFASQYRKPKNESINGNEDDKMKNEEASTQIAGTKKYGNQLVRITGGDSKLKGRVLSYFPENDEIQVGTSPRRSASKLKFDVIPDAFGVGYLHRGNRIIIAKFDNEADAYRDAKRRTQEVIYTYNPGAPTIFKAIQIVDRDGQSTKEKGPNGWYDESDLPSINKKYMDLYNTRARGKSLSETASGQITGTKKLGARLHSWHTSMSDPIYAVGSVFYAGKPADHDDVKKAISNLRDTKGSNGKQSPEATKLADDLQGLLKEANVDAEEQASDEFAKDSGLRSEISKALENDLARMNQSKSTRAINHLVKLAKKYGKDKLYAALAMGKITPNDWYVGLVDELEKSSKLSEANEGDDTYGFRSLGRSYVDPLKMVRGEDLGDSVQGLYSYAMNTSSIWKEFIDPVIEYMRSSNNDGTYDRAEAVKKMIGATKHIVDGYKREFDEEFKETFPNGKVPLFVTDAAIAMILSELETEEGFRLKTKTGKMDEATEKTLDPTRYASYIQDRKGLTLRGTEPGIVYSFMKIDDAENFKKDAEELGHTVSTKKADTGDIHMVYVAYSLKESEYSDVSKETDGMDQGEIEVALSDVRVQIKKAFDDRDGDTLKQLHDRERALVHASDKTSNEAANAPSGDLKEGVSFAISGDGDDPNDMEAMAMIARVVQAVLGPPKVAVVGVSDDDKDPAKNEGADEHPFAQRVRSVHPVPMIVAHRDRASAEEAEAAGLIKISKVPSVDHDGEGGDPGESWTAVLTSSSESVLAEGVASASVIKRQISQDPNIVDKRLKRQVGSVTFGKIGKGIEDIPSVEVTSTKDGLIIFSGKDAESKAYVAKMANKIASDKSVPTDAPIVVIFPSQHEALQKEVLRVARVLKANIEGRTKPNWLAARRRIEAVLGGPVQEATGSTSDEPVALDQAQLDGLKGKMVKNGLPVRFMSKSGRSFNIQTGQQDQKGINVIYQTVYWNFDKETAKEVARMTNTRPVFSEETTESIARDLVMAEIMYQNTALESVTAHGNASFEETKACEQIIAEAARAFGGRVRSGEYVIECSNGAVNITEGKGEMLIDVSVGDAPARLIAARKTFTECASVYERGVIAISQAEATIREAATNGALRGSLADAYICGNRVLVTPKPAIGNVGFFEAVLARQFSVWSENQVFAHHISEASLGLKATMESVQDGEFKDSSGQVVMKIESKDLVAEGVDGLDTAAFALIEAGSSEPWIQNVAFLASAQRYQEWVREFPKELSDKADEVTSDGFVLPLSNTVLEVRSCGNDDPRRIGVEMLEEYVGATNVADTTPLTVRKTVAPEDEGGWVDGSDVWDITADRAISGVKTIAGSVQMHHGGSRETKKGAVVRDKNGKTYFVDRSGPKAMKRLSAPDIKIAQNDKVELTDSFEPSIDLAAETVMALRDEVRTVETAEAVASIVERWLIESEDKFGPKQLRESIKSVKDFAGATAPKNTALSIALTASEAYRSRSSFLGEGAGIVSEKLDAFAESFRDKDMPSIDSTVVNRMFVELSLVLSESSGIMEDPANLSARASKTKRAFSTLTADKTIPPDTMRHILGSLHELTKIGRDMVRAYREESPESHSRLEKTPAFRAWVDLMDSKAPGKGVQFSREVELVSNAISSLRKNMRGMQLKDKASQLRVGIVADALDDAMGALRILRSQIQKDKPSSGEETVWEASYSVTSDTPDDHAQILSEAKAIGMDLRRYYDDRTDQYDWKTMKSKL